MVNDLPSNFSNNELSQVFYNKGDKPETFYIVKEGKVSIETNVELEKANKWPVVR